MGTVTPRVDARQGGAPAAGNPRHGKAPGARRGPKRAKTPAATPPTTPALPTIPFLQTGAALAALGSSRRGLDPEEARRRRAEHGPNALPRPRGRSVTAELAAQLTNMFAVVLVVASALTFLIYGLSSPRDPATLVLAFGILGVVVLNAVIGFVQEHAAERTAQALQAMVPRVARVLRSGQPEEVAAQDLVPGDVVLLEAGDEVPADARVIEAHSLLVEMAALTGESQPVTRVEEPWEAGPGRDAAAPATDLLQARNCVLMGTSVTGGTGKAAVFATGLATEFGRIYRLTAGLPAEQSPLQRQITLMARWVAAAAITAGALLFALRVVTGSSAATAFVFALGVMVALVPEGLPATLSVSLAIGVRRMARHNALIKRLAAVEALGSTTVVCTDKTGTLTRAEMTVQEVYASGRSHPVTGVGYQPVGNVDGDPDVATVLRAGSMCSDARLLPPQGPEGWRVLGDTTEGAILVAAVKAGVLPVPAAPAGGVGTAAPAPGTAARAPVTGERVGGFPFDPDRKLMSTVHRRDGGYRTYVKGSPQEVLARCTRIRRDGHWLALDDLQRREVERANDAMASRALRVLAVATRDMAAMPVRPEQAEQDLGLLGLVGMADPPRPEVAGAVAACGHAGIRVIMVTGDYGLTAEAVARRVGIIGPGPVRSITGAELDRMDGARLDAELRDGGQLLFARVRPEHKLRIVAALEAMGEIVAVTGDGANDAPALKRASIGVAMGRSGTDVARAAAVMVLLDDSFASITAAVELGRAVYQNIRRFLVYLFSHNLAELAPILAATVVGFPLVPLSALQVLAIDLGSDVLPALALGAERPEPGTMERPPRPTSEHLFSWAVVRRFLFLGTIQSAGVVFAFFWRIHSAHLPYDAFTATTPTYREALTVTQAGIVVSQVFNSFAVRTDRESVLRAGLWSNPPLVGAGLVGLAFMAAVSYVPLLQGVFHTAPLRVSDWLMVTAFGVLLLAADEARKAWHRRADRRSPRRGGPPAPSAGRPPGEEA